MQSNKKCLYLLVVYILLIFQVYCTTHWLLTDDGKIQAQMDSIFQLRRPYDFLALAQQEQRALQVEILKEDLLFQKSKIDHNEDKDTQLEERIYRTDSDCVLAGKPLTEFNLYESTFIPLESVGIDLDDYLGPPPILNEKYEEPDCAAAFPLDFSMFALDHLQSIKYSENLTMDPEDSITCIQDDCNPTVWGHRVAKGLETLPHSWVLHTMGAHYWRTLGYPHKAIACLRRALYESKRSERHIPLVHLGNVLHRSRQSDEAAIVLHMAIDHHMHSTMAHITLGNIYATLAFYNVSVLCLENALYMNPDSQDLKKRKHAVLCHSHFEGALERQHQSLQRTLSELRDYQKRHEEWLNLQQKLLLEQATPEMKLESRLEYEEQKIRESTDGRGQDCFQYQQDGHTFLSCNMRRDQLEHRGSPTEMLLDLQSLLHNVETEFVRLGQHVLKRKPKLNAQIPTITSLQPSKPDRVSGVGGSVVAALGEDFPTKDQCDEAPPLPQWDAFPTVFLPAENKGFQVKKFLGEDINVKLDEAHELPWFPPICERLLDNVESIDNIPGIKERHLLTTRLPDLHAKPYLDEYGFKGEEGTKEAEVGQRINTAMIKGVAPQWLLYNLAGLFWRVHGNLYNGIECLRTAVSTAPPEWRDVPLVNMASLLYTAGHIDDALTLTLQAIAVADHEAETNFLLGNLYFGKGNLTGAWKHYERVLVHSPNHELALQYLTALACHTRVTSPSSNPLPTCQNGGNSEETECMSEEKCPSDENNVKAESGLESKVLSSKSSDITVDFAVKSDDPVGPENKITNKQLPSPIALEADDSTQSESDSEPEPLPIKDDPLPDVLLRVRERVASPPPPPHVCERANKLADIKPFTSTWLSVSAKNIDISDYLVDSVPDDTVFEEPNCPSDLPASMHTLDHLSGVKMRKHLRYFPEMGLIEAFQTIMDKKSRTTNYMATTIAQTLQKNETSWVAATAAALFWRVMGNSYKAVECLRLALHYAPRHMKDIPLISLANVLHRAGIYNNALVVANMALEISPKFVVIHFTMANIYAAKGDLEKATAFYQSTLALQSSFEPARDRLRAIQCATINEDSLPKA